MKSNFFKTFYPVDFAVRRGGGGGEDGLYALHLLSLHGCLAGYSFPDIDELVFNLSMLFYSFSFHGARVYLTVPFPVVSYKN